MVRGGVVGENDGKTGSMNGGQSGGFCGYFTQTLAVLRHFLREGCHQAEHAHFTSSSLRNKVTLSFH